MTAADQAGGDGPHPRRTTDFFGHEAAEAALLEAYRSTRIPHAWLIGGPPGIGKATLAYRMARFVLAHPDPALPAVQQASSLAVDPDHQIAHRIAAQSQGDLLVLERAINENTGKQFTVIRVDDVRRTVSFFGSTAGEGGWRVCIVDTADEMNDSAANALLKVLEEPPRRALFLLVSNAPGRLWPTIRSRCRRLDLRPLSAAQVASAAAAVLGRQAEEPDILAAAAEAEGSVGQALSLLDGTAMAMRQSIATLLDQLPQTDPRALHALGEALGGPDQTNFSSFVDAVNVWLSHRLAQIGTDTARLARVAETWELVNRTARQVEEYNLERKPLVFTVFALLAETARG